MKVKEMQNDEIQQDAQDDHFDTRIEEAHEEDKVDEMTEIIITQDNDNEKQGKIIEDHFNTALIEFTGTDPCHRPSIPKPRQNYQLSKIIQYINSKILPKQLNNCEDIERLQLIVATAGSSHCKNNGTENTTQHNTISNKLNKFIKNQEPHWMCRLKTKITNIRTKLAQMIQYRKGPRSKKLTKKVANIIHPVEIDNIQFDKLTEIIDHYTQKLAVYSKRLRRYKECTKRKQQNASFSANPKKFYRKLRTQTNLYTAELPKREIITNFWADMWEKPVNYNTKATWLEQEKTRATNIPDMTDSEIIKSDIEKAIKRQIIGKSQAQTSFKISGIRNSQQYMVQ
jgi:hypothetical protein